MMTTRNVYCERRRFGDTVEVSLVQRFDNFIQVAKPVVFEKAGENDFYTEPALVLKNDVAQELMDELWRCGLRPSEGSGSAGSLAATERHLSDMKKIAFDLLERSLKK